MSLSRKIADEVADLAASHLYPACIHAEDGPHHLNLTVALATPMGLECEDFALSSSGGDASLDALKARGQQIVDRVTYLMEPLKILEADPLDGSVLLRSQGPTPRAGRRSYYEVRLSRSGAVNLDRVSYEETTRTRRKTPCQFTAEVFERLVDDLVATAS